MNKQKFYQIVILIMALALCLSVWPQTEALAQAGAQQFNRVTTKALRVLNQSELWGGIDLNGSEVTLDADADTSITADTDDRIDFEAGGTDVVQVDSNGLTVNTGGVTLGAGDLVLSEQTEAVTATFIITPTGIIIRLSSTLEVTSSTSTPVITTTATDNQVIMLSNENASDVIHLDGTGGTVECKANVDLGAGDIATLIYDSGSKVWNCQSVHDNS